MKKLRHSLILTKKAFIVCILLFLSSCSTISTQQTSTPLPIQSWDTRVKTLSTIHQWNIRGLVAIHDNTQKNDVSANLQWQQNGQNYTLLLFGPLGAGATKLTGAPGKVILEASDGKTYTAPTIEALVVQQTNWKLPVSNLYYWIRGLPVPHLAAHKQLDATNHLTQLQQQGWFIQFLGYTQVNQTELPNKIVADSPQLHVKLIVKHWEL